MKKHKPETSKRKAIDSGYETNKRSLSFNPKWSNRYAWIEYDARGWICLPANEVGVESELMFMYAVLNSESMIVPSPPGPWLKPKLDLLSGLVFVYVRYLVVQPSP